MTTHKHTQIGWVIILTIGGTVISILAIGLAVEWSPVAMAVMVLLIIAAALFSTLTTKIRDGAFECRFGPGLIRKRFPLNEIKEARVVRNHWYYGWGIRMTPDGMLFNVSGLDAVEITLADGSKYRIGTDRPRELEDVICRNAGLPISSSPIG